MSKRRKKKDLPIRLGELATKERRHQNGGIETEVIDRNLSGAAYIKRHRAYAECVLDSYFRREYLSQAEFQAGMKFRDVYLRHVCGVKVSDNTNPFINESGGSDIEFAMMAGFESERILRAAYNVLSEKQRTIVRSVCGHDERASESKKIETLQRGLRKLAALWGFV